MDALEDTDRRLLAAASVQGMDFDSAILASAIQMDEEEVESRLERLEREHALVRYIGELEAPDRSLTLHYRFAHHMYQNACFDSVRATRKAALSRAIAERLVQRYGQQTDRLSDIAVLFEVARDGVRAAEYWNLAAQAAGRLYAHDESARLAQRGLTLLAGEPASPARSAAELGLLMTYALAVKTSKGYAMAEVGRSYERARELSRQVEDPSRVIPVLIGMSAHHIVSGEIRIAHDISLEMMALFERLGNPHLQMIGEWSVGAALFHLGALEAGHQHLEKAMTLYDPAFHGARVWQTGIEPGIFCRCELSRTMTLRGFPEPVSRWSQEAVAAAGALDHPQPRAFALLFEMFVHLARRAPREVQRTYEQLAVVCHAHGIAQEMYWAAPLVGRAIIEMGDLNRGLRVLEEGLAAHTLTRSALIRPYYLVLLAGAQLRAGRLDRAQASLDESTRVADATGQHCVRRRALAAAGRGVRRRRGRRRRRAEVSRGARDLPPTGRAVARTACRARLRPSPRRARPARRGPRPPAPNPVMVHRRPRHDGLSLCGGVAQDAGLTVGLRRLGSRLKAQASGLRQILRLIGRRFCLSPKPRAERLGWASAPGLLE